MLIMDKYDNFNALKSNESDYFIELCDRKSSVTILAPHGGKIEPHTSNIAQLIAGVSYNYFCFNGVKKHGNQDLHISSHRYDEEQAIALSLMSTTVITVHGCKEQKPMIYLGGLDRSLRQKIAHCLDEQNLPYRQCLSSWPISGTNPDNICNRGITGKGAQLEISRGLRDSAAAWKTIATAARCALLE